MDGLIHGNLTSIKQKRLLLVCYLCGAILFVVGGIAMLSGKTADSGELGVSNLVWGSLAILFFGMCAVVIVRDLFAPKIVFAYNDDGFYLRNLKLFIRWDDVLFAKIFYTWSGKRGPRKTDLVLLKLRDETMFVNLLTKFGKFWYLVNKKFCGYGVGISLQATGVRPEYVMSIFKEKCRGLPLG